MSKAFKVMFVVDMFVAKCHLDFIDLLVIDDDILFKDHFSPPTNASRITSQYLKNKLKLKVEICFMNPSLDL